MTQTEDLEDRMTLPEMIHECHQNSVDHGFWEGETLPLTDVKTIGLKLSLVHSEASEALEDARDGAMRETFKESKPVGFPTELADVVIRVFDLAEACGIEDFEDVIRRKMAYNRTRPAMHGKSC